MSSDSPDRRTLDRSALSGVAWSSAAKWSAQLFSWLSTILVARLLLPADYGLLAMAGVFLGIVSILSEFGIGKSVLTLRELTDEQICQLNALSVLLGLVGSGFVALASGPLGVFFRAPELPAVLATVGITYAINSLQVVPAALLRREMRFRTLALIDLARGLTMPITTLIAALLGMRYWSLVFGGVAGATVASLLTLVVRREGFAWPRWGQLRHVIKFSFDLLVSGLAWIVYQEGDFAVAGRRLGEAGAGWYALAWTIATNPIDKITIILSEVTPSLFSAVQNDKAALRRYFLNLSELISLATFPASVGLALVSQDLVVSVLGDKWLGAVTPLALLALYAGARSLTQLYGFLFVAVRETRFAMWTGLLGAGVLLPGFVVGSFWGGAGIAASWLVIHPSLSAYSFTRVQRILGLSLREYLKSLRLGLDGTIAMAGVLLLAERFLFLSWSSPMRLVAMVILGGAVFGLTTWTLHRNRLREILAWFGRTRSHPVGVRPLSRAQPDPLLSQTNSSLR